ncbi:LrgB family protein [Enterococcus pseudoavium]|uniref:LrgB family protein n=1 Tax=Enterococcus pseudoavium TaxID=44007 RepID=UPI0035DF9FBD
MSALANNPLFGLALTLLIYTLMDKFLAKVKLPLINPLIASVIIIIVLLKFSGISYKSYNLGGNLFTMMITPATVALGLPLYQNFDKLKQYFLPVILGTLVGVVLNCLLSVGIGRLFSLNRGIVVSLLPKSVTTAISVDLSSQMGGISPVTLAIVVSTGIFGALVGTKVFQIFQINSPVAKGIALGSTSHAIGTGRAIEIGELEGILAGLCICINGLATVALLPILFRLFETI